MIKALSSGDTLDGSSVLILGLSDENWRRLRAGQPIAVKLDELRPGARARTVLLMGGPTEQALYDELQQHATIRETHGPEDTP